jgi:alginate O-acetyltransferase complex protein AlgI
MVFTTRIFLFYFLPLVLAGYYALPMRLRNLWLLAASYVFYGWYEPWFVLLMFAATTVNYACGLAMSAAGAGPRRRFCAVTVSIVASLGLLGFFKYANFAQMNFRLLVELLGQAEVPVFQVALPAGISFYIFHCLSYTIDVYRRDAPPVRSPADFALFVSLFPQLIAGPILRYHTLAGQLVARAHTLEKFSAGAAIFILGFAKKVLLANQIGPVADAVFAAESPDAMAAWFGVIAYAFQIYFDFSGYSDMAIGLGRMLGFEFPKNFDAPYRSQSITEFWRRWHISLSSFLRDYLYIPLGGNRKGPRRTYANLAVVMILGGLWHGANWTFVAWGALHGGLLAFERALGKESLYHRLPRWVRIAITFLLVLFSWVLFRSESIAAAGHYLAAMFGAWPAETSSALLNAVIYTRGHWLMLGLCAVLAFSPLQGCDWIKRLSWAKLAILAALFYLSIAMLFVQSFNPFLYFQF